METGIPVREWWDGDERDLATALEILSDEREREKNEQSGRRPRRAEDEQGRVTGG